MTTYPSITLCPHCTAEHKLATGMTGNRAPSNGDWSICWSCRGVAVFVVNAFGVSLRRPTTDEAVAADADPRVRQALAAAAETYSPDQAERLYRGGGGNG